MATMATPTELNKSAKVNGAFKEARFENILNFRDVGITINEFAGKKLVKPGNLFRAARPDDATMNDRKKLVELYHMKTIMDLRTKTEHANRLKKRQGDLKVPALLQSNAALAEPMQIPGITYLNININGKGFERSLLWSLSAWSFIKLITLMLFGYRMKAISILGSEVMRPKGLVGLGYDSLDHCGPEIAEALRAYSNPENYPIMAHCTQGKDRTGLVICLILLLVKVPAKAITYDYRLSQSELMPERESRLKEIREIGLSDDFADCPEDWIEKVSLHLEEKYGGVREYCRKIEFSEEDEMKLLSILMA